MVGLDWLIKHSPMTTHRGQRWLAFQVGGELVVLHGTGSDPVTPEVLELHLTHVVDSVEPALQKPEIQSLLDEFFEVFE